MGAPHSWGSLGCSAGGLRQCCFFSSRVSHPHSSKTTPTPARSQQLPSRAPAEQTQGIHAIPTPPHTHTHTAGWYHSCRGPVLGFGCPASAPSSVTAPSFPVGAALLHPQTMRFRAPMLLGHWEAWSVSSVNPGLEGCSHPGRASPALTGFAGLELLSREPQAEVQT